MIHYEYGDEYKKTLQAYKVRLEVLRQRLVQERSSFNTYWQTIDNLIRPTRGRFITTDTNRGHRRNNNIADNTTTLAERTLRAGMMAGLSSPARPWFKLSVWDRLLNEQYDVRRWLNDIEEYMRFYFLKSNLYQVLPLTYGDCGTFGTACVFMQRHEPTVSRFYSFPVGSFYLANDGYGKVVCFIREFQFTVRQIIDLFAKDANGNINLENLDTSTIQLYKAGSLDTWINVVHVVKENDFYNPRSKLSMHKRYSSEYYEQGPSNASGYLVSTTPMKNHKFLSRSGFDYFPILAPRWEVTGEDVYGTSCPGMIAIGDVSQLQQGEFSSLEAIDKMVRPPLIGPASLKRQNAHHLPGSITYHDEREGMKGLRSIYDLDFRVDLLEQKQKEVRNRCRSAYFEDLFLAVIRSDRRQQTAREIEEKHAEKLLATGPVLEQLNEDFFDPLINNQFQLMSDQGLLPEAPDEIKDMELRIEYISIMAQAQKLTGLDSIERLTDYVTRVSGINPSAIDKLNVDHAVDEYADIVGTQTKILNSEEDVIELRKTREAQRAAEQEQIEASQMAKDAKTLSETPVLGGESSALDQLAGLNQLGA